MARRIKCASYNCNSALNNIDIIRKSLKRNDILLLQETFIIEDDIHVFEQFDKKFDYFAVPSTVSLNNNLGGRPKGGLCIFWRKNLSHYFKPIRISNILAALKCSFGHETFHLINAYFPTEYNNQDSLIKYREAIAEVISVIEQADVQNIILAGDLNFKPFSGRFYDEIVSFVTQHNLSICDVEQLPIDTFTFHSAAHDTVSWLDHVITSNRDLVSDFKVLYGETLVDHMIVEFQININSDVHLTNQVNSVRVEEMIRWDSLSEQDIVSYQSNLDASLNDINFECLNCVNLNCNSLLCKNNIDRAYSNIVDALKTSSNHLMEMNRYRNFKPIPGWNVHCKEKYAVAREAYLNWNNMGRPRIGPIFLRMKETRAAFKREFNFCKRNEKSIRNENLVASFNNKKQFWKNVKNIKGKQSVSVTKIDNAHENDDILNVFNDRYKAIFDDPMCQTKSDDFDQKIYDFKLKNEEPIVINTFCVKESINLLKTAIGCDNIHSSHLKLGTDKLFQALCDLYNCFIRHSYLPKEILYGEFRPIIKNKFGDKHASNNYRPIMISSNLLKAFEYCILNYLQNCLNLNPRQYGYRTGTSGLTAPLVLNEIIAKYTNSNASAHIGFADFSKAFDKVNHYKLISKLIDENVNKFVINTIFSMLTNTHVNVNFNNNIGSSWKLNNGTRQGAIISPILFCIYINEIIKEISESNIGCRLGTYQTNIIAYADDITLISSSSKGLQLLFDKMNRRVTELGLTLNVNKTVYMVCKCAKNKNTIFNPNIIINNTPLEIVNHYKYLGIEISDDCKINLDIKRCSKAFLGQFYSMYRKFNDIQLDLKTFLFNSYCTSFYGFELWNSRSGSATEYHNLEVTYHKTIKKMLRVSYRESNHYVCSITGLPIFRHFHNNRLISFFFSIARSKSPCITPLKNYLLTESVMSENVDLIFEKVYSVTNVLANDLDALKSRILFVQNNEPNSMMNNNVVDNE